MDGSIAQSQCGVGKVHLIFTYHFFGYTDPHLTKVFNGTKSCLLPEDSLQMRASDGELLTDLLNGKVFRNMFCIIIRDAI